jgi:protein-disulfide isomerase
MKRLFRYTNWTALALAVVVPLGAERGISKKQADEILDELRQIRQLLEKQANSAPPDRPLRARVAVAGAYALGPVDAPITMVEFTDFQCPFCQRFYASTFGELKKNYIDTGKVRFVSRDLPLEFHPNAMQAALAGRCAGEQGRFWPMRDRMGSNPEQLDLNHLIRYAAELKLDLAKFHSCVTSAKYKDAVEKDVQEALRIGASGTPSFVIGKTEPDGVDGELIIGAMPYQLFDEKLKELAR